MGLVRISVSPLGNELAHEVDVIIEVEPGVVKASGRFNAGGEITIGE